MKKTLKNTTLLNRRKRSKNLIDKNGKQYGSSATQLPFKLLQKVDSILPEYQLNSAYQILGSIYSKCNNQGYLLTDYIPLARNYFDSIIRTKNTKYNSEVKKVLIEADILQIGIKPVAKTRWRPGVVGSYRINPAYTFGSPVTMIPLNLKKKKDQELSEIEKAAKKHLSEIELPFNDLEQIKAFLDKYMEAPEIKTKIAASVSPISYIPSSATVLMDSKTFNSMHLQGKGIIEGYLKAGMKVFRMNTGKRGRYYLARCASDLEQLKYYSLRIQYEAAIQRLMNINRFDFHCTRNGTNERLDTPLTNLYSKFLAFCTVKGERIQSIDLRNSQFTILAAILNESLSLIKNDYSLLLNINNNSLSITSNYKILNKIKGNTTYYCPVKALLRAFSTVLVPQLPENQQSKQGPKKGQKIEEIELFIKLCQSGKLYEFVSLKSNGAINRRQAKEACFQLMFDTYDSTRSPFNRILLSKLFPNVVRLVDEYKKESVKALELLRKEDKNLYGHLYGKLTPHKAGNNSFSILLQKVESKIFIDDVLRRLQSKQGIWSASKHDSILYLESDHKTVLKHIKRRLNHWFGAGNYRLSKEWYEFNQDTLEITEHKEEINLKGSIDIDLDQFKPKQAILSPSKRFKVYSKHIARKKHGKPVKASKQANKADFTTLKDLNLASILKTPQNPSFRKLTPKPETIAKAGKAIQAMGVRKVE